eukprot:COSAG05_NODE_9425_length_624_cov_1.154286_1_plen_32_part_01
MLLFDAERPIVNCLSGFCLSGTVCFRLDLPQP